MRDGLKPVEGRPMETTMEPDKVPSDAAWNPWKDA